MSPMRETRPSTQRTVLRTEPVGAMLKISSTPFTMSSTPETAERMRIQKRYFSGEHFGYSFRSIFALPKMAIHSRYTPAAGITRENRSIWGNSIWGIDSVLPF